MKIQVALALKIGGVVAQVLLLFMLAEQLGEAGHLLGGHQPGGEAGGQPFQGLAHMVDFDQVVEAERRHAGADVHLALQQLARFQAADRLAQRPPADPVAAGQVGFADLAARGDHAAHDIVLEPAEDPIRQGARAVYQDFVHGGRSFR